jgi:thiol-disulfide isomerase/thioredoxin
MTNPFAKSGALLFPSVAAALISLCAPSALCAEPRDGDVESEMPVSVSHAPRYSAPVRSNAESAEGDVEMEVSAQPKWIRPQRQATSAPQPVPVAPPSAAPLPAPVQEFRQDSSRWMPAVIHVNDSTYQAELGHYSGMVLIDFYSKMCGPCMKTSPIVDRWGEEFRGQVKVVKIESEKSPRLVERFKVTSLPCLIMMNDGREVNRETGQPSPDLLKRWVQSQK